MQRFRGTSKVQNTNRATSTTLDRHNKATNPTENRPIQANNLKQLNPNRQTNRFTRNDKHTMGAVSGKIDQSVVPPPQPASAQGPRKIPLRPNVSVPQRRISPRGQTKDQSAAARLPDQQIVRQPQQPTFKPNANQQKQQPKRKESIAEWGTVGDFGSNPLIIPLPTPKFNLAKLLEELNESFPQHLSFDMCWKKLRDCTHAYIDFLGLEPVAVNQEGEQILENGDFYLALVEIIQKCKYVHKSVIYGKLIEKHRSKVKVNIASFEKAMERLKPIEEMLFATPTSNKPSALKRSSKKKVSFHVDTAAPLQETARNVNSYLFDFFEINDAYGLKDGTITGILDSIAPYYSVVEFKLHANNRSILCITSKAGPFVNHSQFTSQLKKIDGKYQNLTWLELDGADPEQAWLSSLE